MHKMAKKKVKKINDKGKLDNSEEKLCRFMEKLTTLHGTNYFSVRKGLKLHMWILLMIANIIATAAFLVIIKDRYKSDQIITKIYSNWSVALLPFPTVSICNFNMVSINESRNIAKLLRSNNVPEKEIESFFQSLSYLVQFESGAAEVDPHHRIMDILKLHYYNTEIMMDEVGQKCENLLLYCEFNNKPKNCKDIFTKIQTLHGHCCAFNYHGVDDENTDPMMPDDSDFEYYTDTDESTGESVITGIVVTSQSGSASGLKVVFDVEPDDYPDYSLASAYGATILLNDPNDFPETRATYRYMLSGESLSVKVMPKVFQCEQSLRSVPPEKRGCWFHDEAVLAQTSRYSYETCNTECRSQSYISFCGCIPYKYPIGDNVKSTRICELADLPCLNYMLSHWHTTRKPCDPVCYKECHDKDYSIITDSVPFLSNYYPEYVTKGRNTSNLNGLHVYYSASTCQCYMMSLLMDFNYFIATYGGVFSLCFGASMLTILELMYLLFSSLLRAIGKITSKKLSGK